MIKEYEMYHGIVLSKLVHINNNIEISSDINNDNSSYIVNQNCGLYVKFSKKRLTPWTFTFNYEHFNAIKSLSLLTPMGYVVFVCGNDGVCCVNFQEFFFAIGSMVEENMKSISISRFKKEQYQVNGSNNEISHKFANFDIKLLNSK